MELKKCDGVYNSKIDFKMLCQLNKDRNKQESLKAQKEIFLGFREKPLTPTEKHLKESLLAYRTLLQANPITLDALKKAGGYYGIDCYDSESLEGIIRSVNQEVNSDLYLPTSVLMEVVKKDCFNPRSREMGILLFNTMLVKSNYHPIIFYRGITNELIEMITHGALITSIIQFIEDILNASNKYNVAHGIITTDEVVRRLKESEEYLRKECKVLKCIIYGSVARKEQTKYSDIDIILLRSGKDIPLEEKTREYVSKLFIQPVDLVFISEDRFPKDMTVDFYTDRLLVF